MIPNRKKPYKDDSPVHTINRVRSILNEIGIFVSEHFVKNGNFYACRIAIANEGLSQYCIGTNGKGITLEYAFASAYAEFLERLQNGILIPETFFFSKHYNSEGVFKKQLIKDDNEINYVYGQDEIVCEIDRIVAENFDVLGKLVCVEDKVEMLEFFVNELGYSKDFLCSLLLYRKRYDTVFSNEFAFAKHFVNRNVRWKYSRGGHRPRPFRNTRKVCCSGNLLEQHHASYNST